MAYRKPTPRTPPKKWPRHGFYDVLLRMDRKVCARLAFVFYAMAFTLLGFIIGIVGLIIMGRIEVLF